MVKQLLYLQLNEIDFNVKNPTVDSQVIKPVVFSSS